MLKNQANNYKTDSKWNENILDHIITALGVKDQKPFKPSNQNAEQVVIDSMGQIIQAKKKLPDHLLTLGVSQEFIEKSSIYQVETVYSAWHSILALIYPEYLVFDYDKKNRAVMQLRDTINNEFINDQRLRNEITSRKIRLVHVENAIAQKKIQDEILLRFFAIYFDMNIYLVTDECCYIYHNRQDFTGGHVNFISGNGNGNSREIYNPYKSSVLLYRYPYGNIAPVFQDGRSTQILSTATDSAFILPIAKLLLATPSSTLTPTLSPTLSPEEKEQTKEQTKVETREQTNVETKVETKEQTKVDKNKSDKKSEKEKFINTMMKLKWEEISGLAQKENIKPDRPAAKGYDMWKKKTKLELAEELWEATCFD